MTQKADDRYARQILFPNLGESGQTRLAASSVAVAGCGAVGGHAAMLCVRAGIGRVRLVDHDQVEWSNLHRQVLYTEADARAGALKAETAALRLAEVNAETELEPIVAEITPSTVDNLLNGVDLVLDGLDTMAARYLVNDACLRAGRPWVYAGVDGATVSVAAFGPTGPCLRCLWPELFDRTESGLTRPAVINTAPAAAAAYQVTKALRLLTGSAPRPLLFRGDLWDGTMSRIELVRDPECTCCGGY
ncbi:MAG: HesA/MoeB/ThiF family protein [Thermoanaerobaculales bacterium]|nr:HesA/MoeB/ThiF family protein [Thermoanaerobaculales bacterium]